mmetsp:Transcript_67426/g.158123  ORF Transcript_67426/g.158123 Transcript_67426/m.158123 type:complete len:550 (-) Transcript_67426:49-1698(-)
MDILAFFVVSFTLEVVFLGRLLFIACTRRKNLRDALRHCILWPCRALRALTRPQKAPTAQELLIESEVKKLKTSWSRRYVTAFAILSFSTVLSIQQRIFTGGERWMSAEATWCNVAMFAVGTLVSCFPWLLRPSTLGPWYGVYMVFAVLYVTPIFTPTEQVYTFSFIVLLFFRLPCSLLCTRTSLAILFNLPFVGVMSYRSVTEEQAGFSNLNTVLWTELTATAVAASFVSALHGALSQRVQIVIQGKNAETALGATQALLRLMCDAVVELDEDLCLTSSSPELSAMLQNRELSGFRGMKLTELMPEVEARRTAELLGSFSGSSPGHAGAFNTRMVDTNSRKICVELLQVKYTQMDGQGCHLIGIRDFADQLGSDVGEAECDYRYAEDDLPSTTSGDGFPERKNVFLDIDMTKMCVNGASAPVDHVVGMGLLDLFPAPHTIQLLQRLQHEAISMSGEPLRGNSFLYEDLPISFGPGKCCMVCGSMQVMMTQFGPTNVLLCFGQPVFPKLSSVRSRPTSKTSEPVQEGAREPAAEQGLSRSFGKASPLSL